MKHVVIVGLGALGSHVALLARNWMTGDIGGKYNLILVDHDKVEQKNTKAQMHSRMVLGLNKAQAIQKTLQGLFNLKGQAISSKLVDNNAEAILEGAVLVLDCTDNAAARRDIQKCVRRNDTPCLHGCLSADGGFARVVWDEHFKEDEEGEEGAATCEDGEQLPFFALAAAQMAVVAQEFLQKGVRRSLQLTPTSVIRLA